MKGSPCPQFSTAGSKDMHKVSGVSRTPTPGIS
jgi:hypothetical protein